MFQLYLIIPVKLRAVKQKDTSVAKIQHIIVRFITSVAIMIHIQLLVAVVVNSEKTCSVYLCVYTNVHPPPAPCLPMCKHVCGRIRHAYALGEHNPCVSMHLYAYEAVVFKVISKYEQLICYQLLYNWHDLQGISGNGSTSGGLCLKAYYPQLNCPTSDTFSSCLNHTSLAHELQKLCFLQSYVKRHGQRITHKGLDKSNLILYLLFLQTLECYMKVS